MSSTAIYRIRIRGKLNARLVRHLDGLNITEFSADGTAPDSILVGRFIDQAALSGLLNVLYDFQLPLVAVDCLDAEPSAGPDLLEGELRDQSAPDGRAEHSPRTPPPGDFGRRSG